MTIMIRVLALLAMSSGALASVSAKIVGGDDAGNDYPWMAGLHQYDPDTNEYVTSPFCGGSLITRRWVLTAAHCLEQDTADAVLLRINQPDITSGDSYIEPAYSASELILHEHYQSVLNGYDIALVRLPTAVNIPTVSLADDAMLATLNALPSSNNAIRVLGWGIYDNEFYNPQNPGSPIGEYANGFPDTLQALDMDFVRYDRITGSKPANVVGARENSPDPTEQPYGADTCFGDSGGPLFVPADSSATDTNDGLPVLVGITSYGSTLCDSRVRPGIYTDVSAYSAWIEEQAALHGDALTDMTVRLSHATRDVLPGSTSNATVTLANQSHLSSVSDLALVLSAPAGITLHDVAIALMQCTPAQGASITCTSNGLTLGAGGMLDVLFSVTDSLGTARSVDISATISTATHEDYRAHNNRDSLTLNYATGADIAVTLGSFSSYLRQFSVSVANQSDLFSAQDVVLDLSITPAANFSIPAACSRVSDTLLRCELDELLPESQRSITLTLPVLDDPAASYTVDASVPAGSGDTDTSNNSASYSGFRPLQTSTAGLLPPPSGSSGGAATFFLCLALAASARRLGQRY